MYFVLATILCLMLEIKTLNCDRQVLKIENCTVNSEVAVLDQCSLNDGNFNMIVNVTKLQNEFFVSWKNSIAFF